jgi:hypothetical protein
MIYLYVSTHASHHRVLFHDLQHFYGAGWVQNSVRVTHLKSHKDKGSCCVFLSNTHTHIGTHKHMHTTHTNVEEYVTESLV